ncbi:hypothetical protein [Frankia sp. AvcI1]|uniref:hypothetical protein n=1 Tax=Frankia sp. AvcI1 TaxID=573496 RepID=UPI002118BDDB|nr:hypothetical protein [Frankia sp. AvcI1]
MRTMKELILDAWSALGFKQALGDGLSPAQSTVWRPPLWVGEEHHRRLTSYMLLEAYDRNSARRFRQQLGAETADVREYGDAHLLTRTVTAAVLGDEQNITVEGADEDGEDGAPTRAQTWYRDWWTAERGPLKLHRTERRAVKLGNGIYTLGWDPVAGRARLRDYDPGMYFPAWQDGDEEFPSRVHLAWEIDSPDRTVIRRITWDLRAADDGVLRSYPWRDAPTALVCYLTDATFALDHARGQTVDDLDPSAAVYRVDAQGEIRDRDLGIDFVPVINITNTIDDGDGWGEPSTMSITQILDDLAQTDTDLQAAAATSAKPVLILSGASLGDDRLAYAPGEVLEAGDGTATILDTSRSLDALLKQLDSLSRRASVNGRVPDALLGRVSPAEVPSGLALALGFGPLISMIKEMRLARAEKYRLLLEFSRRLALAGGAPDVPDDAPAELTFGAYLPQDKAAAVELVRSLIGAGGETPVIPVETAIGMLVDAGFAIDDAEATMALLRRQDYAAATRLLDATADKDAVRELLRSGELPDLAGPAPEPPPPVVVQAAGGHPPQAGQSGAAPKPTPPAPSGRN